MNGGLIDGNILGAHYVDGFAASSLIHPTSKN
jgi:hypothetical protein